MRPAESRGSSTTGGEDALTEAHPWGAEALPSRRTEYGTISEILLIHRGASTWAKGREDGVPGQVPRKRTRTREIGRGSLIFFVDKEVISSNHKGKPRRRYGERFSAAIRGGGGIHQVDKRIEKPTS